MYKLSLYTLFSLTLVSFVFASGFGCEPPSQKQEENQKPILKPPTIGILKLGTHEVLDAIVEGISYRIDELYGEKSQTIIRNGHFDRAALIDASNELLTGNADVIITVSTPATMAFLSVNTGKKPLVFTFVTAPNQLNYSGTGSLSRTTGLSNKTDYSGTLELIKALRPKAKKLGYLISTNESNAVTILNNFRNAATPFDYELQVAEVSSSMEVQSAAESLASSVDAFLIGGDHGVVKAIDSVLQIAKLHQIPVFSVDGSTVNRGCLAASTIDFHELGNRTAEYAAFILSGAQPEELPAEDFKRFHIIINSDVAEELSISIPDSIKRKAQLIKTSPEKG